MEMNPATNDRIRPPLSQADKELLDQFRKSNYDGEIVKKVKEFCGRWTVGNGASQDPTELTNLLYDITSLPEEKQAICEQAITAAKVLSAPKLRRRLKDLAITPAKDAKSQGKPAYSAKFDDLVDLVDDNGHVKYFIAKPNCEPQLVDSVEQDGKKLYPPPREQLPFSLPSWEGIRMAHLTDEPGRLFADLILYHDKISKLPTENHLILLAAWDFSTYVQELLPYSGYITLFNVAGRGKTRTGVGLINVAFRGIHTITVREATLFRHSHNLGASLFLDVMDLSRKLEKADSEDILLQRFQRGASVSRVQKPEDGAFRDTVYYNIFGPTVIATNNALDRILDTRCFPISMPFSNQRYPDPDPRAGLALKERLVAWRAKRFNKPLPEPGREMSGRLGDISAPLRSILQEVKPDAIPAFDELIDQMQESSRGEKADSWEGRVIQTVRVLLPQAYEDTLSLPTISARLNEGIDEGSRGFINPQRLGHILNSLGFKKGRTSIERFIYVDREQLGNMCLEYGVDSDIECHKEPS